MEQIYVFAIGIVFLVLGIPLGNFLAKITKEELKSGRKWFKLLIILSFIGAIVFLILGNDALLFTFLFIAIVTSRSLKK
jgi:MFS family permease